MSIYAVADLHLSFGPGIDKPMDIFGSEWENHAERLKENWCDKIKEQDTVIIAGDISWGMKLKEADNDLKWIDELPGHKVLIKGNHDLWWKGINSLNGKYDTITFIQNNFYEAEDVYICGSRGWLTPDNEDFVEDDEKVYKREILRLRMSLEMASEAANANGGQLLGVMHFPPVSKVSAFSGFQQAFEDYNVKRVIYGHIHGKERFMSAIEGVYHGVEYNLVSLDYLQCMPLRIK